MSGESPFDRLSEAERNCLRAWHRLGKGEGIAVTLGVSKRTVEGHLAQARRIVGVRSSADAAARFQAHEERVAAGLPAYPTGYPAGVDDAGGADDQPVPPSASPSRRMRLPLRPNGATSNDLTILQRLAWIAGIPAILAIAFGMLSAGVHTVSDILRTVLSSH